MEKVKKPATRKKKKYRATDPKDVTTRVGVCSTELNPWGWPMANGSPDRKEDK